MTCFSDQVVCLFWCSSISREWTLINQQPRRPSRLLNHSQQRACFQAPKHCLKTQYVQPLMPLHLFASMLRNQDILFISWIVQFNEYNIHSTSCEKESPDCKSNCWHNSISVTHTQKKLHWSTVTMLCVFYCYGCVKCWRRLCHFWLSVQSIAAAQRHVDTNAGQSISCVSLLLSLHAPNCSIAEGERIRLRVVYYMSLNWQL